MNSFHRDEVVFGFGWSAKSRAKSLSFNFRNRKSTFWFNVSNFPMKSNRMTHGRAAEIDDGSPMGVQGSPPFSPFVDDEVDKLGKCCVVAILQRKRTGMFAKFADDLFRCARYISCCCWRVCSGRQNEPFERVANENEFGVVPHSVLERVIRMVSVQHCHGIGRGRSSSEWSTSHPSY
jgi:hypothetical protein